MNHQSRTIRIGMPQMALGCLSENWLLKELGSMHWDGLCASLGRQSHNLTDSQGRRLYATFVRVRLDLADTIAAFGEGDELRLNVNMARFGRSTVQSMIAFEGRASLGSATLLSTFSYRTQGNNTSLAKSEPEAEFDESIPPLLEPPPFFKEYSEVRKRHGRTKSARRDGSLYKINPYIDSNGANLLYFASYQVMHDCLTSEPALRTKVRDICYFRNSELSDQILSETATVATATDNRVERTDVLFRRSDGESIAAISVQKQRVDL